MVPYIGIGRKGFHTICSIFFLPYLLCSLVKDEVGSISRHSSWHNVPDFMRTQDFFIPRKDRELLTGLNR